MAKFFLLLMLTGFIYGQGYKNKAMPIDYRVEDLLKKMTLDEKLELLGGTGFATKKNERLGIPELRMTDGPVGVRWDESLAFPVSIGMAATFDPDLINKVGSAIGRETKGHARHVILGPCVNIARIPMGGRNFESFGEDPFLASRMAVEYIKGVQKENVAATVKHFAVNNQEHERMYVNAVVSDRALHEIYLPAFKAAVQEADVLSVMSAYNKINFRFASENDYLLVDILKNKWGFKNLVMSDWGAVHSSIPTAKSGLDLEMPNGEYLYKDALIHSIETGTIPMEIIDDKVKRILKVIFKLGLFDTPEWEENETLINSPENRKVAYETALASIVLLKNKNNILPLNLNEIKSVAVIGPNAGVARTGGGGSSLVKAIEPISPLEALKSKLHKNIKINYSKGVIFNEDVEPIESKFLFTDESQKTNGLIGEYFDNKNLRGNPKLRRIDKSLNFKWGGSSPADIIGKNNFSVRWTGFVKAPKSGEYLISTVSDDGIKFWFDDKLVLQDWTNHAALTKTFSINLEEGKLYKIKIEYYEDGGDAVAILGWRTGVNNLLEEAIEAAKKSDIAILFVGTTNDHETEGRDRDDLVLPAGQDELIKKISEVNKTLIVVLTTGSPVLMNKWIDNVDAVLETWFAGSEGGNAVADVLLGRYNPSGKLPITFPRKWEDCSAYPSYKKYSGRTYYSDDIYVGYRHFDKFKIDPLFPFGYGLSFTSFEYANISVRKDSEEFVVAFDIMNTGGVDGAEVAQLYLASLNTIVDHPVKELKAFKKVFIKKDEIARVELKLKLEDFAYYDEQSHSWKNEPGLYDVLIGTSSMDIKLISKIELKE